MKKLIAIMAIAFFASCGGGAKTETADTTAAAVDTVAPAAADTTAAAADTTAAADTSMSK